MISVYKIRLIFVLMLYVVLLTVIGCTIMHSHSTSPVPSYNSSDNDVLLNDPIHNVDDEKMMQPAEFLSNNQVCNADVACNSQFSSTNLTHNLLNETHKVDLQIYLWSLFQSKDYWINNFTNDIDKLISTQNNNSYYQQFDANVLPSPNTLDTHEIQQIVHKIDSVSESIPYFIEMAILETAIRCENLNPKHKELIKFMELKKKKKFN
eukprot:9612_1